MKYNISRCMCADKREDDGGSYFGMPRLKVTSSSVTGEVLVEIYCPYCGVGGIKQYKSVHAALLAWNEMQKSNRELAKIDYRRELVYNGFSSTMEYSFFDECYYGCVDIDDYRVLLIYDGKTPEEAEKDFHRAVDEYLDRMTRGDDNVKV